MKSCKFPKELLYQKCEHEPTQLWPFPKSWQMRQCHGNGICEQLGWAAML